MDRPLRLIPTDPLDQLARTLEALLVVASAPLSVEELAAAAGAAPGRVDAVLGLLGARGAAERRGAAPAPVAGGRAARAARDEAEAWASTTARPVRSSAKRSPTRRSHRRRAR